MNLQGVLPPLLALLAVSLPGAHAETKGLPKYEIGQSNLIAPISSTLFKDYYTAKIGPAAWVCTDLNDKAPDTAYNNIKSYYNKGNKEGKQMALKTWPVIETRGGKSELCVYLEKKHHCYPPTPNNNKIIRGINEHLYRHYYGRVFWGQASDNRVKYEETVLKKALKVGGITDKKVNLVKRYLSYYPNHVREIRFDSLSPDITELPESSFTSSFAAPVGGGGKPTTG